MLSTRLMKKFSNIKEEIKQKEESHKTKILKEMKKKKKLTNEKSFSYYYLH